MLRCWAEVRRVALRPSRARQQQQRNREGQQTWGSRHSSPATRSKVSEDKGGWREDAELLNVAC